MQIISEELQSLGNEERATLKRIRDKKLFFWLGAFLALIAILAFGYFFSLDEQEHGSRRNFLETSGSEDRAAKFQRIAPYALLFFFVCLCIYFIRYYLRSVNPFMKDFKHDKKKVIQFQPESYKTPYFDTFYLRTNSPKKPMLRISREMYKAIQPGVTGVLCMLPNSRFVLSLKVGTETMEFNEKNTILDL